MSTIGSGIGWEDGVSNSAVEAREDIDVEREAAREIHLDSNGLEVL